MKKTFNDLEKDEKKEFLFIQGLTIDLPYVILIVPFIVILLITSNTYIGLGAIAILICAFIGVYIDYKKLKSVYGLN